MMGLQFAVLDRCEMKDGMIKDGTGVSARVWRLQKISGSERAFVFD
jgi:hypothetical protein